jgi:hypothetical protein
MMGLEVGCCGGEEEGVAAAGGAHGVRGVVAWLRGLGAGAHGCG